MAQRVAASERGARRIRAPRFTMALPAWAWFVCFFAPAGRCGSSTTPSATNPTSTTRSPPTSCRSSAYREAFSASFVKVFSQTLQISIVGTILCLLIAFPFAYWLATRVTPRWRGVLLGLVVVPFFVNFLVRTVGWLILLSPAGPVSNALQTVGPARRAAAPAADARRRPARRRLQLPGADDPAAVRRARPAGSRRCARHRRTWARTARRPSARSRCRWRPPGSSPGCSWCSSRSPATTSPRWCWEAPRATWRASWSRASSLSRRTGRSARRRR